MLKEMFAIKLFKTIKKNSSKIANVVSNHHSESSNTELPNVVMLFLNALFILLYKPMHRGTIKVRFELSSQWHTLSYISIPKNTWIKISDLSKL